MSSTFTMPPPSNRTSLLWRLNSAEIFGSPVFMYPGETVALNVTVEGSNAPTSPAVVCYKGRTDTSATNLSGSATASGQVITLKSFTAGVANSDYSLIITATIAGNTEIRKLVVQVIDDKAA